MVQWKSTQDTSKVFVIPEESSRQCAGIKTTYNEPELCCFTSSDVIQAVIDPENVFFSCSESSSCFFTSFSCFRFVQTDLSWQKRFLSLSLSSSLSLAHTRTHTPTHSTHPAGKARTNMPNRANSIYRIERAVIIVFHR